MTMMITKNRFLDIRDKNQEKRGYEDVSRRSIDANSALVINDYVPCLRFITRLQGWEAYLLGLQRRGREMVVKIIEVEKQKQRAVDVAKDGSYVPDMADVLDGEGPLSVAPSPSPLRRCASPPWVRTNILRSYGGRSSPMCCAFCCVCAAGSSGSSPALCASLALLVLTRQDGQDKHERTEFK